MSNSVGQARFPDGELLFFRYSGTVDSAASKLWKDETELWDNWDADHYQACTCGNTQEVDLATSYGGGMHWKGRACKFELLVDHN